MNSFQRWSDTGPYLLGIMAWRLLQLQPSSKALLLMGPSSRMANCLWTTFQKVACSSLVDLGLWRSVWPMFPHKVHPLWLKKIGSGSQRWVKQSIHLRICFSCFVLLYLAACIQHHSFWAILRHTQHHISCLPSCKCFTWIFPSYFSVQ